MNGIIDDVLYEVVENVKGCDVKNTSCTVFKKVNTNKVEIPTQTNNYFY